MTEPPQRPRADPEPDFFQLQDVKLSIPPIGKIPATREQVRQRWMRRAALVVSAIVAIVVAVVLYGRWRHHRDVESLRERSETLARTEDAEALARELRVHDVEENSLRLRLLAELASRGALAAANVDALAHELDEFLRVTPTRAPGASDRVIAATFLALARRDFETALRYGTQLQARGPRAAMNAYTQALVLAAVGRRSEAVAQARIADEIGSHAPRFQLTLAGLSGDLAALSSASNDDPACALRHELRIETAFYADNASALRELVTHRPACANSANVNDWQSTLEAWTAWRNGDWNNSESPHQFSAGRSEALILAALECAIRARDFATADAQIAALPRLSGHSTRRALLLARLELERNAPQAALAAVGSISGPEAELLRARAGILSSGTLPEMFVPEPRARRPADPPRSLLELRARLEPLAREPSTHDEATAELILLDARLGGGTSAQAVPPTDAKKPLIAISISRALEGSDANAALQALVLSRTEHANDPRLLYREGLLRERIANEAQSVEAQAFAQALSALTAANSQRFRSPLSLCALGRVAHAAGSDALARTSLTESLRLSAQNICALSALARLQVDTADDTGAEQTLANYDACTTCSAREWAPAVEALEVTRARWLVQTLRGAAGVARVRSALRRFGGNGDLRFALGSLYLQAEDYANAAEAFFSSSPSIFGSRRRALLERIVALSHYARKTMVNATIDTLEHLAEESPLTPEEQAHIAVARGWLAVQENANVRVAPEARRATSLAPNLLHAQVLAAWVADARGRGREAYTALRERSVDALGWLGANGDCVAAERYRLAAPNGRFVARIQCSAAPVVP